MSTKKHQKAVTQSGHCPACGGTDTAANTWEAWCDKCGRQWTQASSPEIYSRLRRAELVRRDIESRAACNCEGGSDDQQIL